MGLFSRIKDSVQLALIYCLTPFRKVKYFHPNGQSMPNGISYQRGIFLKACRDNKKKFVFDLFPKAQGGIVVFQTGVENIDEACMGAHRVGNFFYGNYKGTKGELFDANSLCAEFPTLSGISLMSVAQQISKKLPRVSMLVADFGLKHIFIKNSSPKVSDEGNDI